MANKNRKPKDDPYDEDTGSMASLSCERSILGSMLLDGTPKAALAIANLKAEEFSLDSHRRLFNGMKRMAEKGLAIDIITLCDALRRHKMLDAIGGVAYVASLTDGIPPRANLTHYISVVIENAKLREIYNLSRAAEAKATEKMDSNEIIAGIQESVLSMIRRGDGARVPNSTVTTKVFTRMLEIRAGIQQPVGYTTGVSNDLDELTRGAHPSEYIIIAARTGHGKTSMALQMALANAKKFHVEDRGEKVGYYSPEMTRENLIERLMCLESGVSYDMVVDPTFATDDEMDRVLAAKNLIDELPLIIDDDISTASTLGSRIRADIMDGVVMWVVDYLQLLQGEDRDPKLRVSRSSGILRDLAKSTKTVGVALSQLRRAQDDNSETREPQLSDLKESGDIENDAFQVWLGYRPKERDNEGNKQWSKKDKIMVAKNRNGRMGWVNVEFDGPHLKYIHRDLVQPGSGTPGPVIDFQQHYQLPPAVEQEELYAPEG